MRVLLTCLLAGLCLPLAAAARPAPEAVPNLGDARIVGGPVGGPAKAAGDTLVLLGPHGSGAPVIGTFQTVGGTADWNGWSSVDLTADPHLAWHVSTFEAVSGSYSAWCGDAGLPPCAGAPSDQVGGYGNNWAEYLEWRGTVADNSLPCTVTVAALASYDTEAGYDACSITCEKSGGVFVDLWQDSGFAEAVAVGGATVYAPADYLGQDGDEVCVLFRFTSDGAFSGEDCLYPNDGAIRVDDVVITLDNGSGYSHDFEDGTLGDFAVVTERGVGDFAQLWTGLQDLDPCRQNATPQVAFIDDGLVVPGTGGSPCLSWCYGPRGWVVNTTAGVAGDRFPYWNPHDNRYLHNAVVSPPLAWTDPGHDGALFSFDVYRHEDLTGDAPGVFYTWSVRSVASGDPADLARAAWRDRNAYHFGGPDYHRQVEDVADLLVPGRTHVQVRLAAYEYGWYFGWGGDDATPAPYFDNARLESFTAVGPYLAADARNLPADAFPASGEVDLVDLGANSVPLRAASDRAEPGFPVAMRITCAPLGAGAALTGAPELHWRLQRNPLFDPWRSAGLPDQGSAPCAALAGYGPDVWGFDLPDTGFLFPGDRLHCFFTATQNAGGVTSTTILPADTTGFASFADYPRYDGGYDASFSVRALPTVHEVAGQPGTYAARRTLFWHDSGTDADWQLWTRVFHESTLLHQDDLDVFHTRAADLRLYDGLGARATVAQLAGYDYLVYTSGEMSLGTLDGGIVNSAPASPDASTIDAWLRLGNKRLLACGNDLASDLAGGAPEQAAFVGTWFGATVDARDVRPLIDGQTSPTALAEPGNPVLTSLTSWLAYGGGCYGPPRPDGYGHAVRDRFDAVTAAGGAVRLAGWAAPGGAPGAYPYAAALANEVPAHGARVVFLPADLSLVFTDPDEGAKAEAALPARVRLFQDVMAWFGYAVNAVDVSPVPAAGSFAVTVRPNPFNPATTIAWTAAAAGHLTVKVFDVRGRLVRVLHDGPAAATGAVAWDGRDDGGAAASSGVYFYELRHGDRVRVGKLALVK
ncbi:MAG: FlgD immunoglobulin-like domain containing protein [Candidatus Krumholzibacteriia bacterium]